MNQRSVNKDYLLVKKTRDFHRGFFLSPFFSSKISRVATSLEIRMKSIKEQMHEVSTMVTKVMYYCGWAFLFPIIWYEIYCFVFFTFQLQFWKFLAFNAALIKHWIIFYIPVFLFTPWMLQNWPNKVEPSLEGWLRYKPFSYIKPSHLKTALKVTFAIALIIASVATYRTNVAMGVW